MKISGCASSKTDKVNVRRRIDAEQLERTNELSKVCLAVGESSKHDVEEYGSGQA